MADWAAVVVEVLASTIAPGLGRRAASTVRTRLLGDTVHEALQRAATAAFEATSARHGELMHRFDLNPDFLRFEGGDELARVLRPGRRPDPAVLAAACLDRLPSSLDGDERHRRQAALVPVFATFLDELAGAIGRERALDEARGRVEQAEIATATTNLAAAGGASRATPDDERRYLTWVVDRYRTIRTLARVPGHAVEVPLDDVYVTLAAERDVQPGDRAPEWFEHEHRRLQALVEAGALDHVTYEIEIDRLERLDRRRGEPARPDPPATTPVDLAAAVAGSTQLLVLGDPGSGKTTLQHHLAATRARALLGRADDDDLGRDELRFPILVRIGDFARWPARHRGLLEFLPEHIRSKSFRSPGLADLLHRHLEAGTCLVLLDGLDEVVTAQDRGAVVGAITDFVDVYHRPGNRFVVTSRISGYRAAPLPPAFDAYRIQPLDQPTIERFLARYCPAVERFYAPRGARSELVRADAERTIAELRQAFDAHPGIRRLAANPLLLTTLVLVHRASGRLPTRRIDAYVEITDALGGLWRRHHDVPAQDLPDERILKTWLTRLGGWLHERRPDGAASMPELLEVLGELWAREDGSVWDPRLLDAADALDSPAAREIGDIVRKADQHCGLLVERAPERYGFPHLTFEEFYAGRSLIYEGRVSDRAARIRRHLHHPLYEEPILLGLGLLARDNAEALDDIVPRAIYGATTAPSPHDELLGHDLRFALRLLADDIPVASTWVDQVISDAIDEWFDETSRCRFTRHRQALAERLAALAGTRAAKRLAQAVERRIPHLRASPRRFCELAATLAPADAPTAAVLATVVDSDDPVLQLQAASVLAEAGTLPEPVVGELTTIACHADHPNLRSQAADLLAGAGRLTEPVVDALVRVVANLGPHAWPLAHVTTLDDRVRDRLTAIATNADDPAAQIWAGSVLVAAAAANDEVLHALAALATTTGNFSRPSWLPRPLAHVTTLDDRVRDRLTAIATNADDPAAQIWAGSVLVGADAADGVVLDTLAALAALATTGDVERGRHAVAALRPAAGTTGGAAALTRVATTARNPSIRSLAGMDLANAGTLGETVVEALATLAISADDSVAAGAAGKAVVALVKAANLGEPSASQRPSLSTPGPWPGRPRQRSEQLRDQVITALTKIATTAEDAGARTEAGVALARAGRLTGQVVATLTELVGSDHPYLQAKAAVALAEAGQLSEPLVTALTRIANTDHGIHGWDAVRALAKAGRLTDHVIARLTEVATTADDPHIRIKAGAALAQAGNLGEPVVAALADIVTLREVAVADVTAYGQALAVEALASAAPTRGLVATVTSFLGVQQHPVREAAVDALTSWARADPATMDLVTEHLVEACTDPDLDTIDDGNRAGWDYAHEGLWALTGQPAGPA